MGLQDRGYYREEAAGWQAWERRQNQSVIVPLIIVNAAVFLLDAFTPGGHWLNDRMAITPETLGKPWMWWQFLTYGFAHAPLASGNVLHILGNMFMLYMFGRPVEEQIGKGRFLRTYLLAIVVAGVGSALIYWLTGHQASVVGASGAVSAILMMFVFRFPNTTIMFMFLFPMRAWIVGVIVVAQDFLTSLSPTSHVAGEAHLFGAAFGAICHTTGWSFRWLDWSGVAGAIGGFLKGRPRLRIHDPGERSKSLAEQADAVLAKIQEQGLESLTKREQDVLARHSQQVRERRAE